MGKGLSHLPFGRLMRMQRVDGQTVYKAQKLPSLGLGPLFGIRVKLTFSCPVVIDDFSKFPGTLSAAF